MQNYSAGTMKQRAMDILSPPPRSGHFSIYAQKLSAQIFVWLCSIVTWGNVSNAAAIRTKCHASCIFQIGFGLLIWIATSVILMINFFAERSPTLRNNCFSHQSEAIFTGLLIVLWIPVIITVSLYQTAPLVATWFSWLGFFGSIYACFKAYHSSKESDLPTDLPDGYDEEDYVYG